MPSVNLRTVAHLLGFIVTIAQRTQQRRRVILVRGVRRLLVLDGLRHARASVVGQVVSGITTAYDGLAVVGADLLARVGRLASARTEIRSHGSVVVDERKIFEGKDVL